VSPLGDLRPTQKSRNFTNMYVDVSTQTLEDEMQKHKLNIYGDEELDDKLLSLYNEHKCFSKVSTLLGGSDVGWSVEAVKNRFQSLEKFKIENEVNEANNVFLQFQEDESLPPEILAKYSSVLEDFANEIELLVECASKLKQR
jgi:hypothetical protein